MNYFNRASRCRLRQNLHTLAFCIITVELLGGDITQLGHNANWLQGHVEK